MLTEESTARTTALPTTLARNRAMRSWEALRELLFGRPWSHSRFLVTLAAGALLARVIVAVGIHAYLERIGRHGFTGADDASYDRISWALAQHWHGAAPPVDA